MKIWQKPVLFQLLNLNYYPRIGSLTILQFPRKIKRNKAHFGNRVVIRLFMRHAHQSWVVKSLKKINIIKLGIFQLLHLYYCSEVGSLTIRAGRKILFLRIRKNVTFTDFKTVKFRKIRKKKRKIHFINEKRINSAQTHALLILFFW